MIGYVRIQMRFRNDLLQRLIDEHEIPIYKWSKKIGVSYAKIFSLKSLKSHPYKKGRQEYNKVAHRIANYFKLPVEDLFPDEIYRVKWPTKIEKSFPVERIACLIQSDDQKLRSLPPYELLEKEETKDILKECIDSLTPRESRIIKNRFGIDNDKNGLVTLREIAEDFGVGVERIRQIEARALRKLRHPSRSNKILGIR